MINLIVARGSNNVIGKDNDLVWNIPADLRHFKEITLNKTVIMGRKTYESIGFHLPKRQNLIVSRNGMSIEESISKAENEIFIIGGSEVYQYCLENDLIDKIYLTQIHSEFEGDTYFSFDEEKYICNKRTDCSDNGFEMSFLEYERR